MKNKTLAVIFIVLMALAASVPFWLEAIQQSENNDFLYTAIIFWLTGIACVCSGVSLITELKKIDDKVWLLPLIIIPIGGFFLSRSFGGASVKIESKLAGIFSEPIMWILIATLIGHLVLFFYKQNKQQMN